MIEYSPIAALNRTYALAKANGKAEAIVEAEKIGLTESHLYHALLGELYTGIDNKKAISHLQQALKLAKSTADKAHISDKILACGGEEITADRSMLQVGLTIDKISNKSNNRGLLNLWSPLPFDDLHMFSFGISTVYINVLSVSTRFLSSVDGRLSISLPFTSHRQVPNCWSLLHLLWWFQSVYDPI